MRFVPAAAVLAALLCLNFANGAHGGEIPDLAEVLHRWEQATGQAAELTLEGDLGAYRSSHSAHELEAAAELLGPVSARELITRYAWSCTDSGDGVIRLEGEPRDNLCRLFFSGFEIELNATTFRPQRLVFRDAGGTSRNVAIVPPHAGVEPLRLDLESPEIQLASLVQIHDAQERTSNARVEEILARWEAAIRSIQTAEIHFTRYVYDLVFRTEERSEGRFRLVAPRRGVYELRPAQLDADARSERVDADGRGFAVKPGRRLIYCWDDGFVIIAHPDEMLYDKIAVPKSSGPVQVAGSWDRLWSTLASPQRVLPGTVRSDSEDCLEEFEWSLLEEDDQRLMLQGRPAWDLDRLGIAWLQVILDPQSYRPRAIRWGDSDGSSETVHVIRYAAVNDDTLAREWRPDFSGYTECTPALAPPADEGRASEAP